MSKIKNITDAALELELGGGTHLPGRSEIPERYRWKLSDIYKSDRAWENDFNKLKKRASEISEFRGKLGKSKKNLLASLKLRDELSVALGKLIVYANMKSHEDTSLSKYQGMASRVSALAANFSAAASFMTPEILEMPEEKIKKLALDPELKEYAFGLNELLRQKKHVLSKEEEIILARASEMAETADNTFSMLTNADMKFASVKDDRGRLVEMSEERAVTFLRSKKRSVRKAAFTSLYEPYGQMKNTLGATFGGMLKSAKFFAQSRNYSSPLAAALDSDNIPEKVYHNLVDTLETNLAPLHRYMELRKKALRLNELHMYDLYVPLSSDPFKEIPWSRAKVMMEEALKPLGEEYLADVRAGLNGGWTDVFANRGKRSGAYSWGSYATHPYIFMNYTNTLNDVSTFVHEMGHSIHSLRSGKNQPYATSNYSIFTAEVSSTTNEVLFLDDLIAKAKNKKERAYLLGRRLENIRTTVYRQTMFASFEREVHAREAKGEDTTPDGLKLFWRELNEKYYGPGVVVDKELEMEWARIPHFYNPFYVFQYATGFSAAVTLARGIVEKGEAARRKYLQFLAAGGSDYPINLLKKAGVDMSTPKPVKAVVKIFDTTVSELADLLGV